jgi:two-component system, LytTR family, response regulator
MLHTIIVDDDPMTLDTTELELQQNCSNEVTILKKCSCAKEGLEAIRQLKPDLVILDVEMPTYTGIQIVEILRGEGLMDFDVIFTTAHEEFSIKAFELNALHYLLKPYHAAQLVEAVNRAKAKHKTTKNNVSIEQVEALIQQSRKPKTLRISTREGIEFLPVDDILFVQADGNYATIYLSNNDKRVVSIPLKDIENQLVTLSVAFQRTHQSYLVNFDFLKGYRRDGSIILRGYDLDIPVSRNFKSGLSL